MSNPAQTPQRIVTLIRHAKAAEDNGMLPDALRVLNARGQQDAEALKTWLTDRQVMPDYVLCSTAQRTRQTLAALKLTAPVAFIDALYLAPAPLLLKQLQSLPDTVRHVALIGHNPGLHVLAAQLVGSYAHADDEERLLQKFPTSAVASITFADIPWSAIAPAQGRLELLKA